MKQTYLKLMTEHHPDKQAHQQQHQQQESSSSSSSSSASAALQENALTAETITHAFQILKSPHTRAQHWLELHGCKLGEATKGSDDEENSFANPQELVGMEFLMEIMEWREAIEDASTTKDQSKLEAIASETRLLHQACVQNLQDLLEASSDPIDEATLQDARQLTAQLQYWHRLETTLKEAIEVE